MKTKRADDDKSGDKRPSGEGSSNSGGGLLSGPGDPGSRLGLGPGSSFTFTATGTINLTGEALGGPGDPGSKLGDAEGKTFTFTATGTINLTGDASTTLSNVSLRETSSGGGEQVGRSKKGK